MLGEYLLIILFGSMVWRGLFYVRSRQEERDIELPHQLHTMSANFFVNISMMIMFILGFVNGFMIDGFVGMVIIGLLTFAPGSGLVHLLVIKLTRNKFNILHPLGHFYLLWPAYFFYSIFKIFQSL